MIYHILILLVIHFIGDFVLQNRQMGLNKGKSLMWLSMHVGVYFTTLLIFGFILGYYISDSMTTIFKFCFLNAIIHWFTDLITSKCSGISYTKMLYFKENKIAEKEMFWQYMFWLVIGFDQLLHAVALLLTYQSFFIR